MYDHIGLRVRELKASVRFYQAALACLGHELAAIEDSYAGLGPKGAAALWLHASPEPKANGAHVAFHAPNRAAVDRFHRDGLAAGGRDNGAPELRADYSPGYYAAYLIDPDGNNVEAVCLSEGK